MRIELLNKLNNNNQKQLQLDNNNKKLIKELKDNENSNPVVAPDKSTNTNNNSNNSISRHTNKSSALGKTVAMTHKTNESNANSILSQIGMSNASNFKPKNTKRAYNAKNKLHVKKHYKNTGLNPQNNPFLNPNAYTPKSSGGTPHVA